MKKWSFIFILFLPYILLAQDSTSVVPDKNNNKIDTIKEWEFFTIAPRIGVGIHHNPYFEIGLSGVYVTYVPLFWATSSGYASMIFHQTTKGSSFDTYGFKIGIQFSWNTFMHGLEVKYLNFESENNIFFSYKIGLSLLDAINIEYAINLLEMPDEMIINTRHQIGLNFNLNRKLYGEIKQFF